MLEPILQSVLGRLGEVIDLEDELKASAAQRDDQRSFLEPLRMPGLAVIAEIKRRSPSAGPIDPDLDVVARAREYRDGGASCLSVLTEPDHFWGSFDDLQQGREESGLPTLCKSFVLHPAQLWQAAAAGADAVLLIAAVLDDEMLGVLLEQAEDAGVAALVEVHSKEEALRVSSLEPALVGVNNRDLDTFAVDLGTAERLRRHLPPEAVTVAESGVSSPQGAARMAAAGYDAILVGEALVRSPDAAGLVAELRRAGR
jgi:indole-3-glycerol phosphate synthase